MNCTAAGGNLSHESDNVAEIRRVPRKPAKKPELHLRGEVILGEEARTHAVKKIVSRPFNPSEIP